MFSMEIWKNARWQDLYVYFSAGSPPLFVQILVLNTLFLVYSIVRGMRSKSGYRRSASVVIQAILICANFLVVFQKDLLPRGNMFENNHFSRDITDKMRKGFMG